MQKCTPGPAKLATVCVLAAFLLSFCLQTGADEGLRYGTVREVKLDVRHAELEKAALEVSPEGVHEIVAGTSPNKIALKFDLAHPGVYEVKLLVVSPFYHPHYGIKEEFDSTLSLAGQRRSWPIRTTEQPRYRNAPLLVELAAGPHTLVLENLPEQVRLREVMLVEDSILTRDCPELAPPFAMLDVIPPVFSDRTYNIIDYGAREQDGPSFSEAVKGAIEACNAAGGGKVSVPPGVWHTAGPIHLKSNVRLHVERGADIFFSTEPSAYLPPVFVRWAGIEMYNYSPLIYARDCENIALTGRGRLVGQGAPWWVYFLEDSEASAAAYAAWVDNFTPVEKRDGTKMDHVFRPQFFQPINCRNILIEDITFESGPFWTIDLVYCENVLARRIKVFTIGPNGDGICADSSRNLIVERSFFSTEDDAVAFHTGVNDDGRRVNKPSENVIVRHNRFSGGYWGGFALGSLTTAGIRNVLYHDNHHADMNHAFYFKSTLGRGGIVENIHITNVKATRMYMDTMTFTTSYSAWFGGNTGAIPTFRDIFIKGLHADNSGITVNMSGLPFRPIENLVLEDVSIINASSGAAIANVRDLRAKKLRISTAKGEAMTLDGCQNFILEDTVLTGAEDVDLRVKGADTAGIVLVGEDAQSCRVITEDGAPPDAVAVCGAD